MPEVQDMYSVGSRGFWPNQSIFGDVPDTLIGGSNVVPRGPGFCAAFGGYGANAGGRACETMMPVKDTLGGLTAGSVIYSRGDTYWFVGSGEVFVGTQSLGNATSNLTFRIGISGGNIIAGVPMPISAPAGAHSETPPGSMTGTFSFKIAWKRSSTGEIGNASLPSATVVASGSKLSLTGPTVPTGIDRVRVYVCARGFSTTGPWLFLSEHTVAAGSPLSLPTTVLGPYNNGEWSDGDRANELAPINNFTPQALGAVGTHVLALGSVMVIIGDKGGYYYSFPTKPETYSPLKFAALPGPVVGIQPRAADGWAYVWGSNYLAALIITPDGDVIPRILWANIGLGNPDAGCLVESELFAFDGEPIRTTQAGDPDTGFGLPVRDYMRANLWGDDVVVGYSPEWNAVVYFNGSVALAYYRSADAWSTPLTGLTGVRAAVTVGRELRVAASGTSMSSYGNGSGTSAVAITPFRYFESLMHRKTTRTFRVAAAGNYTVDLFTNGDLGTVKATWTVSQGATTQHSPPLRSNVHNAISYALKFSFSGDATISNVAASAWLNESVT